MKTWTGKYTADGGALRIDTPDCAVDFINGVGDGTFNVTVTNDYEITRRTKIQFINSFIVKNDNYVTISGYDGENEPIYTLPVGQYAVFVDQNGDMFIYQWFDTI
jgi:hypothetical protein